MAAMWVVLSLLRWLLAIRSAYLAENTYTSWKCFSLKERPTFIWGIHADNSISGGISANCLVILSRRSSTPPNNYRLPGTSSWQNLNLKNKLNPFSQWHILQSPQSLVFKKWTSTTAKRKKSISDSNLVSPVLWACVFSSWINLATILWPTF